MDAQEIFNKVATHLFQQNDRAMDATNDYCRYRGDNGTKCAVGCLIPDEVYDYRMECNGVEIILRSEGFYPDEDILEEGDVYEKVVIPELEFLRPHESLLGSLQVAHDEADHWLKTDNMRNALRRVAHRHSLDASILDTLSFSDR